VRALRPLIAVEVAAMLAMGLIASLDVPAHAETALPVRCNGFVQAKKAVFEVEYRLSRGAFCSRARTLELDSMRKRLGLGAWRRACS
jgi:type II secretory pathway component PulJ